MSSWYLIIQLMAGHKVCMNISSKLGKVLFTFHNLDLSIGLQLQLAPCLQLPPFDSVSGRGTFIERFCQYPTLCASTNRSNPGLISFFNVFI